MVTALTILATNICRRTFAAVDRVALMATRPRFSGCAIAMRLVRFFLLWICAVSPVALLASSQAPQAPVPLVLVGGTVVDVTDWGRSAKDLQDAVVIVQNGRITDVGTRASLPVPKGARILDCTGKFIIPGLVDGFAGMNSQAEANANLYMGVTTVVASSDNRRGHVDLGANPTPHVYLLDSIGSTDDWSQLIGHPGWTEKLRETGASRRTESRRHRAPACRDRQTGHAGTVAGAQSHRRQYPVDHRARPPDGPDHLWRIRFHALQGRHRGRSGRAAPHEPI